MPTSANIQGLLFDLGGVLIEIDFERALQVWNQWTPLSIEEMQQQFKMDAAYKKHERGEIKATEYFHHLRKLLQLEASDPEIMLGWNAIFVREIEETADYIQKAKENITAAQAVGMQAVHVRDHRDVKQALVEVSAL